MNKSIISVIVCIAMFACTSKSRQFAKTESISPADTDTVTIDLQNGKSEQLIHKKEDQNIYIKFNSSGYKKLSGYLTSTDSTANIRFSQIYLPNGTMDGPFGRDIQYDIPIEGNYRISIHENMMAGDPWSGDFTVKIELSN